MGNILDFLSKWDLCRRDFQGFYRCWLLNKTSEFIGITENRHPTIITPRLTSPKTVKFSYLDEYKAKPSCIISKELLIAFLFGLDNNITTMYSSKGLSHLFIPLVMTVWTKVLMEYLLLHVTLHLLLNNYGQFHKACFN